MQDNIMPVDGTPQENVDIDEIAASLGLWRKHFRMLYDESGISIEVIKERGYVTVETKQ
jgi:hypothetical protein